MTSVGQIYLYVITMLAIKISGEPYFVVFLSFYLPGSDERTSIHKILVKKNWPEVQTLLSTGNFASRANIFPRSHASQQVIGCDKWSEKQFCIGFSDWSRAILCLPRDTSYLFLIFIQVKFMNSYHGKS